MIFVTTVILQIIYTVSAVVSAARGNTALTVVFCAMMVCEEISAQHQLDRKEARP